MAKRKRPVAAASHDHRPSPAAPERPLPRWIDWGGRASLALLGGLMVYVAYYPSDSVQVERGDALWFCVLALIFWTATLTSDRRLATGVTSQHGQPPTQGWMSHRGRMSFTLDGLIWALAAWMFIAAFFTECDLRLATNEAWLWVAGAAVVTAARRLMRYPQNQAVMISLLLAVAAGMAVHALHQDWVSLPRTRAEYLAAPDRVLRLAGVDAPPDSAARMLFANRLLDGGPTASFALANSLAAVLLAAVLVPAAIILPRGSSERWNWRTGMWVVIAAAGLAALLATRSRSAVLACLAGVVWIWCLRDEVSRPEFPDGEAGPSGKSRLAQRAMYAGLVLVVAAPLLLYLLLSFGDREAEWFAAAPASLEFRLHYWRASLAMVFDRPWFGASPGGFQARYLQFRLPQANETIADPHNFFFETLTSGGFVAGTLLALSGGAALLYRQNLTREIDAGSGPTDQPVDSPWQDSKWAVIGAAIALALIWVMDTGLDWEAGLIVVPIAAAVFAVAWSALKQASPALLSLTASATLIGVMIHLLVSGGWTVPGVVIVVWLTLAVLCHDGIATGSDVDHAVDRSPPSRWQRPPRQRLAYFAVGAALLVCIRVISLTPVLQSEASLSRANEALARGSIRRADRESAAAVDQDRWAGEAARFRTGFLLGRLVSEGDAPPIRDRWKESRSTALRRSGINPLAYRDAGEQSLHLYQRYGRRDDLESAYAALYKALQRNEYDVSLNAQIALVVEELGEDMRANGFADRAVDLSRLGGNIVRDLGLQHVLAVTKVGPRAAAGPIRRPVKDLFRERGLLPAEPGEGQQRSNETFGATKTN